MWRTELTVEKVAKEILDDRVLGAHRSVHVDHRIEDTTVVSFQLVDMRFHILLRGY